MSSTAFTPAAAASPTSTQQKSFKVVYLPHDSSKPVSDLTITYDPSDESQTVSCLIDQLKPRLDADPLSQSTNISTADMRQTLLNNMTDDQKKQLKPDSIDEGMLKTIFSTVSVDTVPIITPKPSTSHTALTLYVDDKGQLKKLPMNERATKLMSQVGRPLQVLGDAYIARYFDNDASFERLDFSQHEYENDGRWKLIAQVSNDQNAGKDVSTVDDALKNILGERDSLNVCGMGILGCSKVAPLKCAKCRAISYCSKEHQARDWKRHKSNCHAANGTASFKQQVPSQQSRQQQEALLRGGHGHSHNGVACSGHGPSSGVRAAAPSHSHSHGGQACHGH